MSLQAAQASATCVVLNNPFDPASAILTPAAVGTAVRSLLPPEKLPYICQLNGQWILRKDWDYQLQAGDVVGFFAYPQGGGNGGSDVGRTLLMIAAIYVATQYGVDVGNALGIGERAGTALAVLASTTLVNLLVPVKAPNQTTGGGGSTSNTYTASLSGNQARLEEPIPVLYGRNKTFPPFAGQAYSEYDINDDQYYNAVFCIGQGEYNIESILIDDTNINNFQDVLVRKVLPPGTQPTAVSARVVNAPEVNGQELITARYTGPFIACRPKSKAEKISIDVTFSRGLASYNATTGNPENFTVGWQVEYRAVDDFGAPSTVDSPGNWTVLDNPSITAAQSDTVRRSYTYTLPTPCRPQVRVTRTTLFNDNNRVANTIEWVGLRAHLADPAPLCATATYLEVQMRASSQLSGLTQRKIAVISRRKLRTWSSGGGWSASTVETRNPAWALADKWTNTVYGDGYPDARCDLAGLATLAVKWDARQDRFDGVFDQTTDSFQADQMIAQAGRAAAIRRSTVMSVVRDELRDLPVTAFTARNIDPGSVKIQYQLANESTPDGVIVEYWNNRIWDWTEILCPAPGVTTPVRPQRLRLFGVTGAKHAEREGRYHIANNYYRRKFPSFTTELEGMIPSFGSAVVFAPSLPGWTKHGDFADFDTNTLLATLTEPVTWTSAPNHYISIIKPDGSLSNPYLVTPGPDDLHVYFTSLPVDPIDVKLAFRERTRYCFGAGVAYPSILRVLNIQNSTQEDGVRKYIISGLIENDLVHAADNALLPKEGELQDPVDPTPGSDTGGGGDALIPYLDDELYNAEGIAPAPISAIDFANNGRIYVRGQDSFGNATASRQITKGWLLGAGPFDASQTVQFDIRVTSLYSTPLGSAINTWLSLDTTRTWYVLAVGYLAHEAAVVDIEIRNHATGRVLAQLSNVGIEAFGEIPLGGGGDGE